MIWCPKYRRNVLTGSVAEETGVMPDAIPMIPYHFFGGADPNTTSSFHVIGEIFDKVYPEGASQVLTNVQSTLVPAGGAAIVDLKVEVPGTYILVDHSLARLQKGAAGFLEVEGPANSEVFHSVLPGASGHSGH